MIYDMLNPKKSGNILQLNPSGVNALSLHGTSVGDYYIQTLICPVRYADFDSSQEHDKGQGRGVVENYIEKLIRGGEVDMIITVSQALAGQYNIDVFGTVRRGGGDDNMNFTRVKDSKAIETGREWIKTTLNSKFTTVDNVIYEWTYNGYIDGKSNPPKENDILIRGSGGSYLSNEIFYRVGKMRTEIKASLQTGHFHISKIQNEKISEDLKSDKMKGVLKIVTDSLKEGFKGI